MVWCDDLGNEEFFDFERIKRLSDKSANYFLSLGIGKGDAVLVILQRRHEYWTALMGLAKIGAVAIPATHMLMEKDLVYRMQCADVKIVLSVNEDELCGHILAAAAKVPSVKYLATVGRRDCFIDFNAEVEKQSETLDCEYFYTRSRDDRTLLYFTSGMTGMPKMVSLSQKYILGHIVTGKYWLNCMDEGAALYPCRNGLGKGELGKTIQPMAVRFGDFRLRFSRTVRARRSDALYREIQGNDLLARRRPCTALWSNPISQNTTYPASDL